MEKPNVVLVTIDSLRYDRCGFAGYSRRTTPIIDELAGRSFVFDATYATGPHTPESVPGFMAGLHGSDIAYYSDMTWKAIPEGAPTISSYLSDSGYRTVATITNPHLTAERNFDTGFDEFRNLCQNQNLSSVSTEKKGKSDGTSPLSRIKSDINAEMRSKQKNSAYSFLYILYRYRQFVSGNWPSVRGEPLITEFVEDLERHRDGSAPIFGWTHLMDPHTPLHPETVREGELSKSDTLIRQLAWDSSRISNNHTPAYDTMYDSAINYVDQQIALLIDKLKRMGIWDNTIFVVTADHGEALYERGIYGHPNHYLFDDLLHVPLLVRTPAENQRRISSLFSLAWLHELLSELLDIPASQFPPSSNRDSHIEPSDDGVVVSDSISEYGHTVSVRDSENKYTKHFGEMPQKHWITNDHGKHWIFGGDGSNVHITTDRGEWNPCSGDTAPAKLKARARQLATDPSDMQRINGKLNQSAYDRLQDLGYV